MNEKIEGEREYLLEMVRRGLAVTVTSEHRHWIETRSYVLT